MNYSSKREQGIALIREWVQSEVELGRDAAEVHAHFMSAFAAVEEEFRVEFDVPGTRYWEHPESDSRFTTRPGVPIDTYTAETCIELKRHEFLARSNLHFGYKDRL